MPDEIENQIPAIEQPPLPETGKEMAHETAPRVERAPIVEQTNETVAPAPVVLPVEAPTAPVDPTIRSIELILSEDMLDEFKAMSPADQARFKLKGEETVSKLTQLMRQTAVKAREVLKLIVGWLRLIPHVNKYFLEQESKIKTDKLLELHRRQRGD